MSGYQGDYPAIHAAVMAALASAAPDRAIGINVEGAGISISIAGAGSPAPGETGVIYQLVRAVLDAAGPGVVAYVTVSATGEVCARMAPAGVGGGTAMYGGQEQYAALHEAVREALGSPGASS